MDSSLTAGERLRKEIERRQPAAPEAGRQPRFPAVRLSRRRTVGCRSCYRSSEIHLLEVPGARTPRSDTRVSVLGVAGFLTGVAADRALTFPHPWDDPRGVACPPSIDPSSTGPARKPQAFLKSSASCPGPQNHPTWAVGSLDCAAWRQGQAATWLGGGRGHTRKGLRCQGEPGERQMG